MKIVRSFALTRESNPRPRAQQSYVGLHHHQSSLYIYTVPLNFEKTSQLQTKKTSEINKNVVKNLLDDFIFRLVFHVHYETMIDLGRNFLLAPNFFLL